MLKRASALLLRPSTSSSIAVRNYFTKEKQRGPVNFNKALEFKQHGNPSDVVTLKDYLGSPFPPLEEGKVRVKMLNAAVNLQDLWKIQGNIATSCDLSSVPGDEGVGVVMDSGLTRMSVGSWVIPSRPGLGTWRSFIEGKPSDFIVVRNDIPPEIAACLFVSPVTAMKLLDDFVSLEMGDVVVQNGGSGLVAQTVAQLAHRKGVKVISVMRRRGLDEYGEIVERTKKDGAFIALSEEHVNTPHFMNLIADLPAPKLALDCSGGKSATNIARLLGEGGTMVTYGNASREPVLLPTNLFLERGIKLKTFNFEQWLTTSTAEERQNHVNYISKLVANNELNVWVESFDMWDFKTVFTEMMYPRERKLVFATHKMIQE